MTRHGGMTRDEALTLAIRTLANAVIYLADDDVEMAKASAEDAKDIAQSWGKP